MSKQVFRTTPVSITTAAVVLSLIGILIVSTPVLAQTGSGVIRGVVRDANQAVVPGASVTITNERTGVEQKTQTTKKGFTISALFRLDLTLYPSNSLDLRSGQPSCSCRSGRLPP